MNTSMMYVTSGDEEMGVKMLSIYAKRVPKMGHVDKARMIVVGTTWKAHS